MIEAPPRRNEQIHVLATLTILAMVAVVAGTLPTESAIAASGVPSAVDARDANEPFTPIGNVATSTSDRSIVGSGPFVVPAGADSALVAALYWLERGTPVRLRARDGREIVGEAAHVDSARIVLQVGTDLRSWPLADVVEGWRRGNTVSQGFKTGAIFGGALGGGLGLALGVSIYREGFWGSSGKGDVASIIAPTLLLGAGGALTFGMLGSMVGAVTTDWVRLERPAAGAGDGGGESRDAAARSAPRRPRSDRPPVVAELSGGLVYSTWRDYDLDGFVARGRFEFVRAGGFGFGAEFGYAFLERTIQLEGQGDPAWRQSVKIDDAMWGNLVAVKRWPVGIWQPHVVAGIGLALAESGYVDGQLGAGLDLQAGPGAFNVEAVWYPRLFDHPEYELEYLVTATVGYRFRF